MNTHNFLLVFVISFALSGCDSGLLPQSNPAAEEAALESATQWLEQVDNARYGQSWDSSAAYFQSAITRDDWVRTIAGVRKPLGVVRSRELKSKAYRTSLPSAPDGEYVVIQFDAVFENKAQAVETVTPMRDQDGNWRVSGYYIK